MAGLLQTLMTSYILTICLSSLFIGFILFDLSSDIVYDKKSMTFIIVPKGTVDINNDLKYFYKFIYSIYIGIIISFIYSPLLIVSCLLFYYTTN